MAKLIVTFESSEQITEDKYKKINPSAEIDETTTIGQILGWYKSQIQLGQMEVKIIELQELKVKKEEKE
jgi:hypothetical protein